MQEEKQDEIHLRDYLKVLIKRRNSALTFFVILVSVVTVGTLTTTPMFKASTKVLIDKESLNIVDVRGLYIDSGYSEDYYLTQYELIKSTATALKVVKNLNLAKRPEFNTALKKGGGGLVGSFLGILGLPGGKSPAASAPVSAESEGLAMSLAKMVQGGLSVEPIKSSRIVNISYEYPDGGLAAEIANEIANAYVEQVLDIRMGSAKQAVEWMTNKVEEQKATLERSQKALQEFIKDKDILSLESKESMAPKKLENLSAQLVAAEAKRRDAEAQYNQVKNLSNSLSQALAVPVIAGDMVIQSLRSEEMRLEKDILETSKRYGDKHPQMIRLKEELRAIRDRISSEAKRAIVSIRNEYELAQAREAGLRNQFNQGKGEAVTLSQNSIQFGMLKREVDSNQQMLDGLLKRIKETSLVEEVKSFNIYIIDKAEVPKGPIKPRKFHNILLAIIVGIFGGVGVAFFLDYVDDTFKTPDDVEEKLSVALLGIIPIASKADMSAGGIETMVYSTPKSSISESYKSLRTSILLSSVDPIKSFVVTSAVENEGKTTTAINLAIAFAQLEQHVLLVDADLRKPKVHSVFGLDNSVGLSNYLTRQIIQDIIKKSDIPNLSIIPAGALPPNPSELLSSKRMKDFIDNVTDRFDMVIFDAAPLITVTDTTILSAIATGTVLVVRSGKTSFDIARRAIKLLTDANSKILGAVLNGMDTKKEGYKYLYPYYYDYGYGHKKDKTS